MVFGLAAAAALSAACAAPARSEPRYFESKVPGVAADPDGAQAPDSDGYCYDSCLRSKEQCVAGIPAEATDLEYKRAQSSCAKKQWACWETCS